MKAAIVKAAGEAPVYADFARPEASGGLRVVDVTASALSHVTRSRAAGSHYSSAGGFPFVAGVDGTGRLDDGRRVYFFKPQAPFGAMAEHSLVADTHCIALPDTLDDVTAAAIAIPGMSSWAALVERAGFVAGETVLINGATGTSGRLAVQVAKHLGAVRIIATGRNAASLEALKLIGADDTIALDQDEANLSRAFEAVFREGVDVVLDYLWGASARSLLIAAAKASVDGHAVRVVQIGAISGAEIALPAAVLRSADIRLVGSGIGSVPLAHLFGALKAVFDAAGPAGLQVTTQTVPLAALGTHWGHPDSACRTVFVP
ncbi:quinone oxidoreductase family protein [Paraburkholderia bryophila]|uniref:NADPH:quinone reductase-like Zn-dependent oxidoreductase n=1 Tax=Paraburkholderia bryophila TaxID=420952 RepID=A0A329C469_9BURK|nr:zinc-binding alcohol dehydrogenase family protein [Paraburkholderia bryophila]RAS25765.1 NADPH:quinone reductase-like Zn-dependent oxidoreductase [Paraburkholderia bryophila]